MSSEKASTIDTFLATLRPCLPLAPEGTEIQRDTELEQLGMTSIEFVSFIVEIEDAFSMSIPDGWLEIEAFETAGSLYDALRKHPDASNWPSWGASDGQ